MELIQTYYGFLTIELYRPFWYLPILYNTRSDFLIAVPLTRLNVSNRGTLFMFNKIVNNLITEIITVDDNTFKKKLLYF